MKIVPNKTLILLVAIGCSFSAIAGPTAPDGGPPQPGLPPPGLPIDGGILALAAAAVIFGLIKVYQFQQNKKTPI